MQSLGADANSVRNPVKNARVKVSTAHNFLPGEEGIDSETDYVTCMYN